MPDETTIAAFLTALGLDADLATLAVPASTTISTFGASLIDDANAAAAIGAARTDALDSATLSLPASTTITAAAATVLDDANDRGDAHHARRSARGRRFDHDRRADCHETNFMVAASSAWASRTPAQAKASLAIRGSRMSRA